MIFNYSVLVTQHDGSYWWFQPGRMTEEQALIVAKGFYPGHKSYQAFVVLDKDCSAAIENPFVKVCKDMCVTPIVCNNLCV